MEEQIRGVEILASYLDNAATTKVCPQAVSAMLKVMTEEYGNPSSLHKMGIAAEREVSRAREEVAAALACRPDELYFTSGGTESDNWALFSAAAAMRRKGRHIITTEIEHAAVINPARRLEASGYEVTYLKPDSDGSIEIEQLQKALRQDTILVSMMLVNNETGMILPVARAAEAIKQAGCPALLHTDAVQALFKIPFTVKDTAADLVSVSAHKVHGPKGAGALYIRAGLKMAPLLYGGGQEHGLRPGTEPVPQIAGFGAACRAGRETFAADRTMMNDLKTYAVMKLKEEIPGLEFIGKGQAPHILSFSVPGYKSEVLIRLLETEGVYVSGGAACHRGKRSHVFEAMKLPSKVIDGSIRISFSRESIREDVDMLCAALARARKDLSPMA